MHRRHPGGRDPSDNEEETIIRKTVTAPLEYGATMLLENLGQDIFDNLKESSGERKAGQIFAMGKYYSGTEYVIFDGTRLVSHSLGELGYNHCGIDDPQMNLQYCFSLKRERNPVYFLCETGDRTDCSMLLTCLREMGKKDVVLIADKGYSTGNNLKWMKDNGIMYVVPLKRNDDTIDYSGMNLSTRSGFDGMFVYRDRPILYRVAKRMRQRAGRPSTDDPRNVASVEEDLADVDAVGLLQADIGIKVLLQQVGPA